MQELRLGCYCVHAQHKNKFNVIKQLKPQSYEKEMQLIKNEISISETELKYITAKLLKVI